MSFDCPQGDCTSSPPPQIKTNSCDTVLVCANGLCETTNTARSLPSVDITGLDTAYAQAPANMNGMERFFYYGDSPPPVPTPDGVRPVVGPGPRPDVVRPQDGGQRVGLIDPAPRPDGYGGLSADQIRSVLADRDRAMALHRGEKPGPTGQIVPGGRNDVMPPAPDGKLPSIDRPGDRPGVQPSRTEFSGSELEAAKEAARASNRPLLIKFSSERCGWCTKMEEESWPNVTDKVNNNFIVVKAQAGGQLERKYGLSGAPATVIASPDGQLIDKRGGFVEAGQLGSFLDGGLQQFRNNPQTVRPQDRPNDWDDDDGDGWGNGIEEVEDDNGW